MILFLKNFLFTLLVPGAVAVYVPLHIASERLDILTSGWSTQQFLALFPLALGATVYFWCLWDFAVSGRGTPAPIDAPTQLVVKGLYRYVRNPMYIGVLSAIPGWAVIFESWAILRYGIAVGVAFYFFVLLVEEPMLRKKFGQNYESYCLKVGRWLPKKTRKHPT